ncbi:MAG TPA: MASE1 domain-containing protein [Steroidobacteraceae bacterium]|nr:MASE1 domain-containing protein [Steroidobacteraceae bacterium]
MSDGQNVAVGVSRVRALDSHTVVAACVVAVGYVCGVLVGLALTFRSEPISTLWPPNAVLLTGLLLTPPRRWWVLIAAVLPAHLIAEMALGVPWLMATSWYVSNVAESLLEAAVLLRILGGPPRFDRMRDVAVFIVVAGALGPALTSFIDVGLVALVGWRYSEFWDLWHNRTLSNGLAALIVVPLLLGAVASIRKRRTSKAPRAINVARWLESLALLTGLCVTSALVFYQVHPPQQSVVLISAPMPFLLWAAIRRSVWGVSLCLAIVASFSILGALDERGPFAAHPAESSARSLQVFLLLQASSLMLLAASLAEAVKARALAQRKSEELNLALRAARLGTWTWDLASDRITHRRRGSTHSGRLRSYTQSFRELLQRVRAEDRDLLLHSARRALQRNGSAEVEFRVRGPAGGVCWIASRGKVLLDAAGKPRRMIGVYGDTTLRRTQEAQLHAQREQIARLNKASLLGEVSAALAHELKQPLTAILTNAQAAQHMVERGKLDLAGVSEILTDIINDDERANGIIERLRTVFVRGDPLESVVDTNECIQQVLAMEGSYLTAHNVSRTVELDSTAPLALIDTIALQQVLINLIVNACDAMEHTAPEDRCVRINTAALEGGVKIEVGNSGPPLPDSEQIFEPFFTTKPDGIGLGLAICRTVVGAHQGRLWATSEVPRGVTFHIWLPSAGRA